MGRDCWLSPLVRGTLNASANQDTLDNFMLSALWEQLGMSCWNMDQGVWPTQVLTSTPEKHP